MWETACELLFSHASQVIQIHLVLGGEGLEKGGVKVTGRKAGLSPSKGQSELRSKGCGVKSVFQQDLQDNSVGKVFETHS